MDREYEEIYADVEARHPWFVARRELFADLAGPDLGARVLDIGCGTGQFLAHLQDLGCEHLAGVEPSSNLRAKFRRPQIELFSELPERRFDQVFLLDVLEHIDDDRGTLARIRSRLEPGGRLFLSVPAHPFLWSRHDEINQHRRRYRRKELKAKLDAAGFHLLKLSYWNSLCFPVVCLSRWLGMGETSGDFDLGGPLALAAYGAVLRLENRLVRRLPLPPGVSLIAVAQKPRDPGRRSLSRSGSAAAPGTGAAA